MADDDPVERAWAGLTAERPFPPGDEPCLALNMVMSVDGRTAIDGRVGALTGPVDQGVLRRLRASADAVLVGASTVRAEGYGSLLRGADRQPLLAVVTRSGAFAPDAPFLGDTASPLVLLAAGEHELPQAEREVHAIEAGDLRVAIEALRAEHGVRTIVCEGGAALTSSLLDLGLIDEIFVTLSPVLVHDDDAPTIARGAGVLEPLTLIGHAAEASFVFSRYAVGR